MRHANRPYRYTKEAAPPSQEVLLLYVEGKLPKDEKDEVAAFLRDHPLYAEAMEGLTGSDEAGGKNTDLDSDDSNDFLRQIVHDPPESSKRKFLSMDSDFDDRAPHQNPQNVRGDVEAINNKIDIITAQDQKGRQKTASIPIWRYAAAAILVLLMGFAGYFLTVQLNQQPPAVLSEKQSEEETPEGPIAGDDQDQEAAGDGQQAELKPLDEETASDQEQGDDPKQEPTTEESATDAKADDPSAAPSKQNQGTADEDAADRPKSTKKKEPSSSGSGKALQDGEAVDERPSGSRRTRQNEAQAYQANPEARKEPPLLAKGMERFQQEDYSAALKAFSAVIEDQPENLKARYYAGLAALKGEQYATALDHFNYLVGPEPRHTYFEDALWQLGQTHLRMGDTTQAKRVYERIEENEYNHYNKAVKKLERWRDE